MREVGCQKYPSGLRDRKKLRVGITGLKNPIGTVSRGCALTRASTVFKIGKRCMIAERVRGIFGGTVLSGKYGMFKIKIAHSLIEPTLKSKKELEGIDTNKVDIMYDTVNHL